MPSVLLEAGVVAAAAQDDVEAAIERLLEVGEVFVLGEPGDFGSQSTRRAAWTGVQWLDWTPIRTNNAPAARRQGGQPVDPVAAARLSDIRSATSATWLIGDESTISTARTCPALRIVCVGPTGAANASRPDHRAPSLLAAARLIETLETFA